MGGDFDVFEPVVGNRVRVLGVGLNDYDVGGDGVAGGQIDLRSEFGLLNFVGHRHGIHETGDGIAVDEGGGGLIIHGFDASGEGIAPGFGGGVVAG